MLSEVEELRFETYNKALFVKKYGISMYIPRAHSGLSAHRLLRVLFIYIYKNVTCTLET